MVDDGRGSGGWGGGHLHQGSVDECDLFGVPCGLAMAVARS